MEAKSISVLVIDGDSASRNYLSTILGKNGYTVLLASLGREGLIRAWRDNPDVIIFDPALPDLAGLDLVTRLRQDRRTSEVPCVALSSRDDPQERAALMSAGRSEFLVKSSQAPQKLLEILQRFFNTVQTPEKLGKLVVFLSAKGGTGTSSLCANIATCLANSKEDKRVAVLDMVLPIGSISHIVGYEEQFNLVTAAMLKPDQTTATYFKENLPQASGWNFFLLAGAPDPDSANQLSGDRVSDILNAILQTYDFVFVDLGRALSRISIPIIQQATAIVLVVSTDLATANLTQTVWTYLKAQGVSPQRVFAIQNRAVGLEGPAKAELEKMIDLPIYLTIPYMGDNLTVANNRHVPITAQSPNDSVSMLLKQVANRILTVVSEQRNR
ncbi:MAG: response regulator [Chloroflexota bacterium]